MNFERIPKVYAKRSFDCYIDDQDKFYRFVDEFNIVGVQWSQPQTISASYFLRLLENGSVERATGYRKGYNKDSDDYSLEMNEFYLPLLDHSALWKMKNGNVICTAMPYGDKDSINDAFSQMLKQFEFPDTIHLQYLDNKYHFRQNGEYMILIYCEASDDCFDPLCSDIELQKKAKQHSGAGLLRYQTRTASFVRDRYVSEYAKRRAQGICQLCGEPAPFADCDGVPFLETHHIIWLADGGADSIENTVALCPNCHRKMHFLDLDNDIERLQKIASNTDWPLLDKAKGP